MVVCFIFGTERQGLVHADTGPVDVLAGLAGESTVDGFAGVGFDEVGVAGADTRWEFVDEGGEVCQGAFWMMPSLGVEVLDWARMGIRMESGKKLEQFVDA